MEYWKKEISVFWQKIEFIIKKHCIKQLYTKY